jgi:rubredoxin
MRKEDARWKCPTCGITGVALRSRAPLCHICGYKVTMILLEAEKGKEGETSSDIREGD